MNEHTPGPWEVEDIHGAKKQIASFSEDGNRILLVEVFSFNKDGDMALIAAAPDLFDALRKMDEAFISLHGCYPLDRVTSKQRLWNDAMSSARAALAKALGIS